MKCSEVILKECLYYIYRRYYCDVEHDSHHNSPRRFKRNFSLCTASESVCPRGRNCNISVSFCVSYELYSNIQYPNSNTCSQLNAYNTTFIKTASVMRFSYIFVSLSFDCYFRSWICSVAVLWRWD